MYIVPILLIILLAIGIFFGPLLAIILLVLGVIVFGGLKFFNPSVASESAPPAQQATLPANAPRAARTEEEGGLWGETWPEERAEEEQSTSERS